MKSSVHVPVITPEMIAKAGPDSPLRKLRARTAPRRQPEHDGQAQFFALHVDRLKALYPKDAHLFDLVYANPNWQGIGTARMGEYLKAEGKKAGVPDLTLPVARFRYHGLYVECKIGRTALSRDQRQWMMQLHLQNFAALCVRGETPEELAFHIAHTVAGYIKERRDWDTHAKIEERWL